VDLKASFANTVDTDETSKTGVLRGDTALRMGIADRFKGGLRDYSALVTALCIGNRRIGKPDEGGELALTFDPAHGVHPPWGHIIAAALLVFNSSSTESYILEDYRGILSAVDD
jgi:hypothetical protein